MTPDERNMLTDLANKFAQTPAPPKDQEAEDFIRTKIGNRPDALYLMTQTVLIQNLAIQHAQQQIQELQERISQSAQVGSGSFLGQQGGGRGFGSGSSQQYSAAPPQYAPQYSVPSPSGPSPSAAPSFLRGAAQTAAGVAAGALAFEGIQSLFSHPGYGGGGGFFGGGGGGGGFMGGGAPVEETVVNNYYDSPGNDYRADNATSVDAGQYDDQGQDDQIQADDSSDIDTGGGFDDNSSGDNFA
jgi:hypothetical protein